MASRYQAKTTATSADVEKFLAGVEPEQKRDDCREITQLMTSLSGEPATMWGPSMVGFGKRQYVYDSGHSGEIFVVGFSPRKKNIVLYLYNAIDSFPEDVKKLGKVKTGVGCIYLNTLADLHAPTLKSLISKSIKLAGSGLKDVSKQSQRKTPAKKAPAKKKR